MYNKGAGIIYNRIKVLTICWKEEMDGAREKKVIVVKFLRRRRGMSACKWEPGWKEAKTLLSLS